LSSKKNPSATKKPGLKQKVDYALDLIERTLAEHERPVVGCSFGKDSMVVLHMVRRFIPDVEVVFINTGAEYPDTVHFARKMSEEWRLNLKVARPETNFWKIVEKHGFPLRTRGAGSTHAKGRKGNPELRRQAKAASACCEHLKKKPMKKMIAANRYDLQFDGITAAENELRRMLKFIYGDCHYVKSWGLTKCHPIMDFTLTDVWDYHRLYDIPYNAVYDKVTPGYEVRTGCWCCTIPLRYGKLRFLREHYPRHYKHLMTRKGLAAELIALKLQMPEDEINEQVVEDYLANYPCFFDDLKIGGKSWPSPKQI
jgi:3'-phosphoadenosine 5'-phosphosulfate sulfotransferase (PAPS reductase)/FAD synthetase